MPARSRPQGIDYAMNKLSKRSTLIALLMTLAAAAPSLGGCGGSGEDVEASGGETPAQGVLKLVQERKLSKLLSSAADDYEASGVTAREGFFYITFDNMTSIGIVNASLSSASEIVGEIKGSEYEGITFEDHGTAHFYVMKEMDNDSDPPRGKIIQLDASANHEGSEWTDVGFEDDNKGFEGIAWVWANEADHLLGLCEGNFCKDESASTGNGRIKVLLQQSSAWVTETTLNIPPEASFRDYSDIALLDNGDGTFKVAIVSQESSALWLGTLTTSPWELSGPGIVYAFPRTANGALQYCDIEGVTFLNGNSLAFVSDKSTGSDACKDKDESVHIFAIP